MYKVDGYYYDDRITIPYGQLKEAQNEAFVEGLNAALATIARLGGQEIAELAAEQLEGIQLYKVPTKRKAKQ